MKKKHGIFFGFAVLLITAMFTWVGCDNDSGSKENTDPKVIKITGMGTAGTEGFIVGLFSTMPEIAENPEDQEEPENEITGSGKASNGVVTIELKVGSNPFDPTAEAWTGTGSYYVNAVDTATGGLLYLYTNGKETVGTGYSNVTKVNFSDTVTTLSLDKFASEEKEPEEEVYSLAEWNGTWNSIHDYLSDTELDDTFQAVYDALPDAYKTVYTSMQALRDMTISLAVTDFGSFVVQGDTITFYEEQTQENPSGTVLETVTYTYKGIVKVAWQGEEVDFYAFEGDKAGAHKYLIFEEAERDTQDGPLHFHIRYGSESIDSLVSNDTWAPTIVSYDTTFDELKVFMSGD
jgi:Zn/Cd-binding protein ZinT